MKTTDLITSSTVLLWLLVVGAAWLQGPVAAAKCTLWQADITKTNFGINFASNKSWEAVYKNGKIRTPYNQYCFTITEQAHHKNSQACEEAGFGVEHCCVQTRAVMLTLLTDPSCTADKKSLALLKKAWFSLDPNATSKTSGKVTAVFRPSSASGTINRFEVTVKKNTVIGAGKELCINIHAGEANKCRTLRDFCGGLQCKVNITTARFKVGNKFQTCCIGGSAVVQGCPSAQELFDSVCVDKCPVGSTHNSPTSPCVCADISQEMFNNACAPKCPAGSLRNTVNGVCECTNASQDMFNNACVPQCPLGSTRNATSGMCAEQVNISIRISGIIYEADSMASQVADAAMYALGLTEYPKTGIHITQGAHERRLRHRVLLQALKDTAPRHTQSRFATMPMQHTMGDMISARTSTTPHQESSVAIGADLIVSFDVLDGFSRSELEVATSPTGTFLVFFRNRISTTLPFDEAGGGVCFIWNGACKAETVLHVIKPLSTCGIDVCFLMDGSGSMFVEDGTNPYVAWEFEASVVDHAIQAIGDPAALVTVLQFSSEVLVHIPPVARALVDTMALRNLSMEGDTTDMADAILRCQRLLTAEEPMASSGHAKVIILLTDGGPDRREDTISAAQLAMSDQVYIATVGVGYADLEFLDTIASGPAYQFSAESFLTSDAANLGAIIAPAICDNFPTECRIVTKPEGVDLYPSPCIKEQPINASMVASGTQVQYYTGIGHTGSTCDDAFCWIKVKTPLGLWGWMPSGSPTLPRTLPCGEAPGVAFVICCDDKPCTRRFENTVLWNPMFGVVKDTSTSRDCGESCRLTRSCYYWTWFPYLSPPVCLHTPASTSKDPVLVTTIENAISGSVRAPQPMEDKCANVSCPDLTAYTCSPKGICDRGTGACVYPFVAGLPCTILVEGEEIEGRCDFDQSSCSPCALGLARTCEIPGTPCAAVASGSCDLDTGSCLFPVADGTACVAGTGAQGVCDATGSCGAPQQQGAHHRMLQSAERQLKCVPGPRLVKVASNIAPSHIYDKVCGDPIHSFHFGCTADVSYTCLMAKDDCAFSWGDEKVTWGEFTHETVDPYTGVGKTVTGWIRIADEVTTYVTGVQDSDCALAGCRRVAYPNTPLLNKPCASTSSAGRPILSVDTLLRFLGDDTTCNGNSFVLVRTLDGGTTGWINRGMLGSCTQAQQHVYKAPIQDVYFRVGTYPTPWVKSAADKWKDRAVPSTASAKDRLAFLTSSHLVKTDTYVNGYLILDGLHSYALPSVAVHGVMPEALECLGLYLDRAWISDRADRLRQHHYIKLGTMVNDLPVAMQHFKDHWDHALNSAEGLRALLSPTEQASFAISARSEFLGGVIPVPPSVGTLSCMAYAAAPWAGLLKESFLGIKFPKDLDDTTVKQCSWHLALGNYRTAIQARVESADGVHFNLIGMYYLRDVYDFEDGANGAPLSALMRKLEVLGYAHSFINEGRAKVELSWTKGQRFSNTNLQATVSDID